MPDLAQQLRDAVDGVTPVSINDAARLHHRHRQRTAVVVSSVAVAALLVAGIGGLVSRSGSHPTTVQVAPAATPTQDATSSITRGGVTVTLSLQTTSASRGAAISGTLKVINRTRSPIRSTDGTPCAINAFSVVLVGKGGNSSTGETSQGCIPGFMFGPGHTTLHFTIQTTSTVVGADPLPAGAYTTSLLLARGLHLPLPPPITVTLTATVAPPMLDVIGLRFAAAVARLQQAGISAPRIIDLASPSSPAGDVIGLSFTSSGPGNAYGVGIQVSTGRTQPSAAQPCQADNLTLAPAPQAQAVSGQSMIDLAVTNTSTTTCRLVTRPTVSLLDSSGQALPVSATGSGEVTTSGTAPPVILAPGQAAYLRVTASSCNHPVTSSARSVRLTLPGSTQPLTINIGSGPALLYCSPAHSNAIAVSPFEQSLADLPAS